MELSNDELNLLRQWYNVVEDLNPNYLTQEDRDLYDKIKAELYK